MLKNLLLLPSIVAALILFTVTVYAQTTLKDTVQEKRQAAKDSLKEIPQAKKAQQTERFQAQRLEFKQKIETIKDEQKKVLTERISEKVGSTNTNRTSRMTEALEKLSSILTRIQEKAETAKSQGKDTAALDNEITAAQTAIDSANAAVSAQSEKEYILTIETEATLRNTVGATVKQLQSDLKATHKIVVEAKQAVSKAAKELAKLHKTTTPSVAPTAEEVTE